MVGDIIRPPERYSSGRPLCFTRDVFYPLLLSPGCLRAPSADRRETLPHDRYLGAVYNASPKIRGPSPKKLGAKNMQNSARFQRAANFDCEYLRNGSRYPNSEKQVINYKPSHVGRRKEGELWSTNKKVIGAHVDPPKLHFSGDYILALRGCWPLKF